MMQKCISNLIYFLYLHLNIEFLVCSPLHTNPGFLKTSGSNVNLTLILLVEKKSILCFQVML